jgi:hypothetical protein
MDRFSADLDRQLGEWLREEATTRASAGLVEAVFARTSRTRQARRWWPPASPFGSRRAGPHLLEPGRAAPWWGGLPLAGGIGIVVVVAVLALTLRPTGPAPGGPTASPSASPQLTPSPSPSTSPGSPSLPQATLADGTVAGVLQFGRSAGPIDVVAAFDSIWTANIYSHDVSRIDPATLEETDRILAGTGPAWFAVTADALWVTHQTGQGLARIDPATNVAGLSVGVATPCGAPVLAFESLWASACDDGKILRIDPSTSELISEIPAPGYRWLALAQGRLFTGNAAGLAEVNPTTRTVTNLGFCCGDVMGSDGQTIWLNRQTDVVRMDPADGTIVSTFPIASAGSVTFEAGRAWLTASGGGVIEIDLASNHVLRTIPVPGSTLVARESAGVLWVSLFDESELWRIIP